MRTRLKFTAVTGLLGLLVGVVVALAVREESEAFPTYVVVPFVVLFALAGASAKKDWVESVLEFFYNVLP
jgi:hypothetical protein